MIYDILSTGSSGNAVVSEKWVPVSGFEGLYEISDLGRMRSYKVSPSGKILSLTNKTGDYIRVVLQGIGKERKSIGLHRLVAMHFIPNPNGLPEVNHIDGNRQNNAASNLEWCTRPYNAAHARRMHPDMLNGMIAYNKFTRPKRVFQIGKDGRIIGTFLNARNAEKQTGICARNILQVASKTPYNEKGKIRKTAGGYIWRFESEVMLCDL